ncbi:MAG: isoprenylcysteine carboxylmethyltransferase family protein [Flavobacteriales bacterium]
MPNAAPPAWKHVRDILILPFSVTCIIPYLIHHGPASWYPDGVAPSIAGALMLAAGLALFAFTVALFARKGNGTLAPWTPTQRLIISGPYRYCRNPMISGVLFILIGEALLLRSTPIMVETIVFFVVNTTYFMLKEEPDMLARFGEEYRTYKERVPRWVPRLR